jgi:hypothetical protein
VGVGKNVRSIQGERVTAPPIPIVQALAPFLMPQKDLQERQVGGAYFLARAGYELLPRLFSQIQIDRPGCHVMGL